MKWCGGQKLLQYEICENIHGESKTKKVRGVF